MDLTALYLLSEFASGTGSWRETITSITLWPALDWMTQPSIPVGWTLCFEMLFYAAATLVIWKPKLIWPVLAAFATAMAIRSGPVTNFIGNPIILEFLLGVGLARLPKWRGAVWLIPIGIAVIVALGPIGYPSYFEVPDFLDGHMAWSRLLVLGLPAAMIVWGTLQIDARQSVFTHLGDASYALYLIHLPVVVTVAWRFAGSRRPRRTSSRWSPRPPALHSPGGSTCSSKSR